MYTYNSKIDNLKGGSIKHRRTKKPGWPFEWNSKIANPKGGGSNYEHICARLMREGYLKEPNYRNWLAKIKWSVLEAGCLVNGIEPLDFFKLKKLATVRELSPTNYFTKKKPTGKIELPPISLVAYDFCVIRMVLSNINTKKEIMLTWIPEQSRVKTADRTLEDPLKLINRYLITVGSIPKELLTHSKKAFLRLYQSRDTNEDTRKSWQDNWHTIAPSFKALIDKAPKIKQDISPRKEETLLALIGILTNEHFTGNKYKKPDGSHKTSTIAEYIINHISKQLSDNHIPHGFKKSNLIEIFNHSLDCWKKKKEF